MISRLMKLDQAWLWLPVVMLAGAVICAWGGNFAFWNLLLIAGVIAADRQPDTQMHAGLPVTVRPVLAARAISLLALLWLPLALGGCFLVARGDPGVGTSAVLAFGSVITLVAMWIQTTRILGRAGKSWLAVIPLASWTVYAGARTQISTAFSEWGTRLFRGITPAAIPVAATCWILTAALFLWAFIHAPQSFPVENGRSRTLALPEGMPRSRHALPARVARAIVALRVTLSFGYLWVLYFALALLAGLRLADTGAVACVFLITSWRSIRQNVRWTSFLPVSPGVLLAFILLPALIAVGGGYSLGVHLPVFRVPWLKTEAGAGIVLRASQDLPNRDHASDIPGCRQFNVVPPAEFWLPVVGGSPPLIASPWGETFQPSSQRLDGLNVYNPWAVGCDNSERFLDWQLSRASAVVYGRQVPRDQLADAHSVLSPLAVPGVRAQIFSVAALAAALMCFTLVSMAEDWWRIRITYGGKFYLLPAIMPCAFLFVAQSYVARWASWVFPASLPLAIAMAMVPLVLIYWALTAIFRQLEFVDKPATGADA